MQLPNINESLPANGTNGANSAAQAAAQAAAGRKHSRIHSRNLSIFFPRPGTTAVSSIAEDGAQEIETPIEGPGDDSAPVSSIPTAGSSVRSTATPPPPRSQLGGSFKFGGRPPPAAANAEHESGPTSVPMPGTGTPTSTTSSRRGHHHRHSLSHSFFSFMEPGSSPGANQHRRQPSNITLNITSPSPTSPTYGNSGSSNSSVNGSIHTNGGGGLTISGSGPPSANGWGPISPFPHSATASAFPAVQHLPPQRSVPLSQTATAALPTPSTTQRGVSSYGALGSTYALFVALPEQLRRAIVFGTLEGALACALWVLAQHYESLACTGVAYWVAFDAFGVAAGVYGRMIEAGAGQGSLRLPYGAKRTETVVLFAQAVYLLFSAVYICKETLEHALLSAGDAGHHHHHSPGQGIESSALNYPSTFLWLSFISLSLSSTLHKTNHAILSASGLSLPSFRALYRLFTSAFNPSSAPVSPSAPLRASSSLLLSNPYTLFPLTCTLLLLLLSTLPLRPEMLRKADMLLAGIEALGTVYLAWPACQTLGAVLLQTAPSRETPNTQSSKEMMTATKGTMEALLRTMKEIERHPLVMHLPAPHVWQLSPPMTSSYTSETIKRDEDGIRPRLANGHTHGHARMLSHSPSFARLRGPVSTGTSVKTGSGKVIVTLELHVGKELEDVECLELTRWAWQKCVSALGQGEEGITVGIVRD
ncbi:hypothetical protein M408DRAFT_329541 [Serendipita vermifera MAFF 305830]|uniref:Uncharacterized protein n=1 Tax=Serendipita vermifera MAFF 305830 TaxID=933852 RepID=A0A0C2XGD0_SERVB|nr:hypothetical protein M408DRAFT_329541 [Serendipita vermifera MAFF 305830]